MLTPALALHQHCPDAPILTNTKTNINTNTTTRRAKQAFEMQLSAEASMGEKMKSILRDMRRQWEEEEVGRAKGIETRLRAHYTTIVDNMETQLKLALRLQDDADKQWLEDVEARNKQQVVAMKSFEEKCRRLYDTRLAEYTERTDGQLSEYEDELMKQGNGLHMRCSVHALYHAIIDDRL